MMNEKIGAVLGESIGDGEEVECDARMVVWGRCLKVRVSINTSKSLRRGKMLSVPRGGRVLAMFRYEHLPDFCYVCGRLDHLEQDCDAVVRLKKEGKKANREYGSWLRAEGPAYNMPKEGRADSRSEGESLSSLPVRQKGEQKGLVTDKKDKSGENSSEIKKKASDRGIQEIPRSSEGHRSPVQERLVDRGGKKIDSNPENGGNQQLLSRNSSKVSDSNSLREVEELLATWIWLSLVIINLRPRDY